MSPSSKNLAPPVHSPAVARFEDILSCLAAQGREADPGFLRSVYDFSAEMHKDQVRRSGEPFMIHPLNVAWLLADLKFDQTCVAVGLLHDVLEDTLTTREVLESEFGPEITELVDGVTKIGRHEYVRRDEAQAETFRKMILASAKDIRVIVVKLADRLHNMQTLQHLATESRRRISRETLEIYAPIAHRLGMARVKGDLEDLAFYHLYPHQFAELYQRIAEKMKVGQAATERIRDRLAASLEAAGVDAEISFRVKRYYSIYEKLRRQGIDISQLYDFLAFRIVTGSLKDTYAALGVVHQNWRPIPGRFKDYIAMPKPNLYQSLHTTLVGEQGQPFEVQIRTRDMDLVAEEGIAAHWRYKEGRIEAKASDPNILWLRQLLEWQKEVRDPRTFLTTLKVDLYPDEVYAFTPKGEVFAFPRGATPLDFAYRVHTDLGHHCAGARVNGRLIPLRTPLQNGDMVEVLTNPSRNPSRDWLNLVVTSRAKSKIRQWLNTQQKQRAMEIGRRLFEKEMKKYGLSLRKVTEAPTFAEYLQAEGLSKLDDLYSRVGFGKAEPRQVLERVVGGDKLAETQEKPGRFRQAVSKILPFGTAGPLTVKGHGDLLAYLAKCCNPLPGEEIVGYITRGRGVSVHRVDCPNVQNLLYNPEREIEVKWDQQKDDVYQVSLMIEVEDQQGMLARLTEAITRAGSNITAIEADTHHETGRGTISVVCQLRDRKHLDKLLREVRAISGVLRVGRRTGGAVGSQQEALS
ncbi:MAG TPA: bifunctional (p)ppGpp synthetase/guanosine-3',5'-bis(diphosphate) 3'-pyrophosphohydrolase [Thermoanaerobaculia bacterium]|jgi:GTP pyrophosphokinase|nr:bifunctional (p)ppGpp synthetase/guanosine-3',5'-bis(diphosphate) 3'-pyrophosphohydrolase [Thermoanaerobaculia bacterium]